jgi:hypothetical protein
LLGGCGRTDQLRYGDCWIQRARNLLQGEGAATECDLRAIPHSPQTLACSGDPLSGGAKKGAALDRLKQCVELDHPSETCIHIRQFADGPVRHRLAP